MSLMLVILASIAAIAAFGVNGVWVFLIGLGLLAASEKKNPGVNVVEALSALLFNGVIAVYAIYYVLLIFN